MSDNYAVALPRPDNADKALSEAGDAHMRRREWAEAAAIFERVADRDGATEMKRRLSKNLASLRQNRPEVYETLVRLPAQQQFSIASTASGEPTVVCRKADGSCVSLSPSHSPAAAAAAARKQIYAATKGGEALGLCGMGDGYLVHALAQDPPVLFMDKQQPVFLIEPEPQVVLQCLMIHDYSGDRGPVERARFQWFVGPGWDARLEKLLLGDLFLSGPAVMVGQGFDALKVQERLRTLANTLADRDNERAAKVERHYADVAAAEYPVLFQGDAGRRPRVLLLTTRLSTVLQYSTRDTAAAFERLGWDARVLIEPTPHHRVLRAGIRAALADFKPDLVFQIDHLRHEHNGLFPPGLPFACWVQDHLPHLGSADAGAQVGPTDFVLTDATATYVDKFAYPRRQCIALPKLVSKSEGGDVAPAVHSPSDDLVFVSNASRTAEAMVAQALSTYGQSGDSRDLITECCRRMAATYDAGGSLPTYGSVCAVLRQTLKDLRLSLPAAGFDVLARWLTHPFNDALYRQQVLGWAADAAGQLGLTLALYGTGWEQHPRFAPFARGPVAYGEPLRQLTRGSRINLQVVPYLCLHQRLLDGLMAGGFFLVRLHFADTAPAALLDFVEEHCGAAARTTDAALASVPARVRDRLDGLLADCRPCLCTTGEEDVVAMVRDWQEAGQLVAGEGPLPLLDETGFDNPASLAARVERFVASPGLRAQVTAAQRGSVAARLTYDAGLRRVVARMSELLAQQPHSKQVSEQARFRTAYFAGARAA